jgi:catechol 2,3-dioxygenase-like lactoylglutathione lyase family enzyme
MIAMLKIAVFGFYRPDHFHTAADDYDLPVSTQRFMRTVWEMEPPASRIGAPETSGFVKLTGLTSQPVYVQALSDRLAPGAGLCNCSGYIAIIDAVKILAPKTIQNTLRRLYELHPEAYLIIAAGRQNEPDALSSDEIREILGLSSALLIYPYVPTEPKTVHRLVRRLVRYIDNPTRYPPPIFAGDAPPVRLPSSTVPVEKPAAPAAPPLPRFHGLDHVAITVSDLERALDFYHGLMGFRVLGHLDFPGDERGFTIAYLDTGRGVLELFSFNQTETEPPGWTRDDRQVGMRHFALRVTGLDAIADQLAKAGVPFTIAPMNANGGVRIAFFTDPDGTLIELIEGDLVYSRR